MKKGTLIGTVLQKKNHPQYVQRTSLETVMAVKNAALAAKKRAGTKLAILGPGVPCMTSLIQRIGWRMGWPTAKKIQKFMAAQKSVGLGTFCFICITLWKKLT